MTTSWLIEKTDKEFNSTNRYLGSRSYGEFASVNIEWTTADFAIRFCRAEDAFAGMLLAKISSCVVTEHQWG